jgi:hypothetical protein
MKDPTDLSATVLASPMQSVDLTTMLKLTPPRRRLSVSASYLGVTMADIFDAAGMSPADRNYYTYRRGGVRRDLPSMILVRLAKVIGVSFEVLWDDEALEAPADVIRIVDSVGYGRKHDEQTDHDREPRRTGALRLAAG